ncbi:MAG: heavy metal translocating P-type ATPase, partial [Candidatus Hodarchaeales archaeon]
MSTKEIKLIIENLSEVSKNKIIEKFELIPHIISIKWIDNDTGLMIKYNSDMVSSEDLRKMVQQENCLCQLSKHDQKMMQDHNPDKRKIHENFKELQEKITVDSISCCDSSNRMTSMTKNVPDERKFSEYHDEHQMHKIEKQIEHKHEMEKTSESGPAHDMHHQTSSRWQRFKMNMGMTMDMDHGSGDMSMLKIMENSMKFRFIFSLLLTIPVILYSALGREVLNIHLPIPFDIDLGILQFLLATPIVLYGGWMFFYGAYNSLSKKKLDMSVLIAVGIGVAYVFSILLYLLDPTEEPFYEASAMLVTFVLFGHWMEMRARRGTSDSMRALFELVPPQARLWSNGKEQLISTSEVEIKDMLVIKPGDKVPVDGIVVEGITSIDESLVTGESIPVQKNVNDNVIGGSINVSGTIKIKTTKVGADTALGQIMQLVQRAQSSKAPGQRIADKFAGYLVIVAVSVGVFTFTVWFLITQNIVLSLTFAISAVVIACPDALGLATPTAVAVGTGLGAQHNVLIKDASTLEGVSNLDVVMFDKTGTLTIGKPVITDLVTNNEEESKFSKNLVIQYFV